MIDFIFPILSLHCDIALLDMATIQVSLTYVMSLLMRDWHLAPCIAGPGYDHG